MLRRTVVAAVLGCLLAGCSGSTGVRQTTSPTPRPVRPTGRGTATATPTPTAAAAPKPVEVVRFGVNGTLLSVEIGNPNAAVGLLRTGFALKAYSANGTLLGRGGSGAIGDRCCTIFALPPNGRHGLYADLGPYAARVARVEVVAKDPQWRQWPVAGEATVAAAAPRLTATAPAVVTATVRRTAGPVSDASVQAFLENPDGTLVAVVSALIRCVPEGGRAVRLQLFRDVPAGTRVGPVVSYGVPPRGRC